MLPGFKGKFVGHKLNSLFSSTALARNLFRRVCEIAKTTVTFVISVCLSVRMQHVSPLRDGFRTIWYIKFFFRKIFRENSSFTKFWQKSRVLYMNTDVHLWSHLTEFFLEWEILHINVAQKIRTLILCSMTFSRKLCHLWENVEKYGMSRAGHSW
jgi:hypothetical protein